jgi:alpha-tubulin suppressor-like RCC1 family protein
MLDIYQITKPLIMYSKIETLLRKMPSHLICCTLILWLGPVSFGHGQTIGGGVLHSIALCADSTIMTWGGNGSTYPLGNSTMSYTYAPINPTGNLQSMVAVDGGVGHSVGLRSDGTVWTWGKNDAGQLGLGDNVLRSVPTAIPSLNGVVRIAVGGEHTLALRSDSTVWAWGANGGGQLGDNSTIAKSTPQQVAGLPPIIQISAGAYCSMALAKDSTLWIWGTNDVGQIGNGLAPANQLVPFHLAAPTEIVLIAGGFDQTFVKQANGDAWIWGHNTRGQLGLGDFNNRLTPVPLPAANGAVAFAGGLWHTLFLFPNGVVKACGENHAGQLGVGDTLDRNTLTTVTGIANAIEIAGGWEYSLVRTTNGDVFSWGGGLSPNLSALGLRSHLDYHIPARILGLCPTLFSAHDIPHETRFSPTTSGTHKWIAGELRSSIALPHGKVMWLMGRSHLDSIDVNGSIECSNNKVANCVLIEDSNHVMQTYVDTVAIHPTRDFFQSSQATGHFLPGHGFLQDADTAIVFLSEYDGIGNFIGNWRAKLGIVTMTVLDITRIVPGIDSIDYGNAVFTDSLQGQLYLFGKKPSNVLSTLYRPYVMRQDLNNPTAPWFFAAPTGWYQNPDSALPISPYFVDHNYSVTLIQGKYRIITSLFAPEECRVPRNILVNSSDSLKGPYDALNLLATTMDSVQRIQINGYQAYCHAHLGGCDSLLVSYNVHDTLMGADCPASQCDISSSEVAAAWRPRFLRLPYKLVDTSIVNGLPSIQFVQQGDTFFFMALSPLGTAYSWTFGDGTSSNQVNPVHIFPLSGSYTVNLTVGDCGPVSSVVVGVPPGITSWRSIQISPNPNNGHFTLTAAGLPSGNVTLCLTDAMGRPVWRAVEKPQAGRLDLPLELNLSPGLYIINIQQGGTAFSRKVIVL